MKPHQFHPIRKAVRQFLMGCIGRSVGREVVQVIDIMGCDGLPSGFIEQVHMKRPPKGHLHYVVHVYRKDREASYAAEIDDAIDAQHIFQSLGFSATIGPVPEFVLLMEDPFSSFEDLPVYSRIRLTPWTKRPWFYP